MSDMNRREFMTLVGGAAEPSNRLILPAPC